MIGYMYILKCVNDTYYIGSTTDLDQRVIQHKNGLGSNYTRKHLPVELVYYELFDRIDYAFSREQPVKKWSAKKKLALINGNKEELVKLARNRSDF